MTHMFLNQYSLYEVMSQQLNMFKTRRKEGGMLYNIIVLVLKLFNSATLWSYEI